jgi:mannose-1-phosphate guanylyltransferase/mannose-6-phosphate isomerase
MIVPVILSGGSGTRLWPLSRKQKPKQFIKLINNNTLFTETVSRFKDTVGFSEPIILGNVLHRGYLEKEMLENNISDSLLLLEPEARSTAAAIASVTEFLHSLGRDNDVAVFVPADAYLDDTGQFREYLLEGEQLAKESMLVCFGIKPTYPETGYGYLKIKKKLYGNFYEVDKFVEKPNLETALSFLKDGKYLWNSGIFMCKISILVGLFREYCSDIYNSVELSVKNSNYEKNIFFLNKKYFSECANISFDYAVAEKLTNKQLTVVSMNLLWSDVGSYNSLFSIDPNKTSENNITFGKVLLNNVNNCYLKSKNKILCCSDVEDLVIIEENDVMLVMKKNKSQNIKNLIDSIRKQVPDIL